MTAMTMTPDGTLVIGIVLGVLDRARRQHRAPPHQEGVTA